MFAYFADGVLLAKSDDGNPEEAAEIFDGAVHRF